MTGKSIFDKVMPVVLVHLVLAATSYIFLLKNLDTSPPIHERVTKNERDILEIKKTDQEDRAESRLQFEAVERLLKEMRAANEKLLNGISDANEGQFSATAGLLEKLRAEIVEGKIRAAKNEVKIKNSEDRLRELNEYRSYKPKSGR